VEKIKGKRGEKECKTKKTGGSVLLHIEGGAYPLNQREKGEGEVTSGKFKRKEIATGKSRGRVVREEKD